MRRLAILLAAVAILAMALPTAASAKSCIFAGKVYTEGALLEGQQCVCHPALDECKWKRTITAPTTEAPEAT